HFRKERPRVHPDGVAASRDGASKLTVRKRSDLHRRLHAGSNGLAVHLRHVDVDTHRGDVGNAEKLCTNTTVAGVDEIAYVCSASGDHAVKRRVDFLKALHLLEPADFRG